MSKLKFYFQKYGVKPHEISIEGFFQPQYLIVRIDYEMAIWDALTTCLKDNGGKLGPLDLSDPWDRMGIRAIISREHEMAHYYSFLVDPFATTIQCLGFLRDLQIIRLARLLRENGIKQLALPLKEWRASYSPGTSLAKALDGFEDTYHACQAVLGMLHTNIRDVHVPRELGENPRDRKFWPWLKFCRELQVRHMGKRALSFEDIHEGFAVTSEKRCMESLGISLNDYLRVRGGLSDTYALAPSMISEILGGWYTVTAGIALSITATLPAVAVLCRGDDPGRFDAFTCFLMAMEKIEALGKASEYIKKDTPIEEYVREIICSYYPMADPARLIHKESRQTIEEAFGINEIRAMEGLYMGLPVLSRLEKAQDQISQSLEAHWGLRFMPVIWDTEAKWWPPVIWFKDMITDTTDPETYSQIRCNYIVHLIAESLWQKQDLAAISPWCPGSIDDGAVQVSGRAETAGYFLETLTGFSTTSIRKG